VINKLPAYLLTHIFTYLQQWSTIITMLQLAAITEFHLLLW